jgi:hypothetical protein
VHKAPVMDVLEGVMKLTEEIPRAATELPFWFLCQCFPKRDAIDDLHSETQLTVEMELAPNDLESHCADCLTCAVNAVPLSRERPKNGHRTSLDGLTGAPLAWHLGPIQRVNKSTPGHVGRSDEANLGTAKAEVFHTRVVMDLKNGSGHAPHSRISL